MPDKNKKGEDRLIGGQAVHLTSLDKLYWPDENITKGDLVEYYQSIADTILLYLKDRAPAPGIPRFFAERN